MTDIFSIKSGIDQDELTRVHYFFSDGSTVGSPTPVEKFDNESCARLERWKNQEKTFVKKYTTGSNAGRFFNPNGVFAKAGELSHFDSRRGTKVCEYVPVSKSIFESYQRFLSTGNQAHLRNAEREYLNG